MNLKELTNVKELVEEACEKLGYVIEVLDLELDMGPAGPEGGDEPLGGESLPEHGDGVDEPVDPLEDAKLACVHAYDILAAILDVTEPHRKRFDAQSRTSARSRNGRGAGVGEREPRQAEFRASILTPGNTGNTAGNTVAKEVRDGKSSTPTPRVSTRALKKSNR